MRPGLAVIGARKATPYGKTCAFHFAQLAAKRGICIISGGARGCDCESHKAALSVNGETVVFLGGGCDCYYPSAHGKLFQEIIDKGGALVSEYPWEIHPMPYMFRARNRLIAGLAQAVLIVEAGLPSGTFSTADDALNSGKEVFVVPGAITSASSKGSNYLLYQGATPIIDDESFEESLFNALGTLRSSAVNENTAQITPEPLLEALLAQSMSLDDLYILALKLYGQKEARIYMNKTLAEGEKAHLIKRDTNGRWGPIMQ